jgi:hypothetical protein
VKHYLFVWEKRSPTAVKMGVHWEDGRLCADTLHRALTVAGIDPAAQRFTNLWRDDGTFSIYSLWGVRDYARYGWTVVGMGQKVQAELAKHNVTHLKLVHPAARGAIRARRNYQAHVQAVLA